MTRFRIALFAVVAVTAALTWALPALATQETTRATTITVVAGKPSEFKFKLNKLTAAKGAVTFKVTNNGALPHDFKIAGKKTKLLSPGQSQSLKVTFSAVKKYPFICTVSGHAAAGMKGTFTIK